MAVYTPGRVVLMPVPLRKAPASLLGMDSFRLWSPFVRIFVFQ
jgi:hypothetical protein